MQLLPKLKLRNYMTYIHISRQSARSTEIALINFPVSC